MAEKQPDGCWHPQKVKGRLQQGIPKCPSQLPTTSRQVYHNVKTGTTETNSRNCPFAGTFALSTLDRVAGHLSPIATRLSTHMENRKSTQSLSMRPSPCRCLKLRFLSDRIEGESWAPPGQARKRRPFKEEIRGSLRGWIGSCQLLLRTGASPTEAVLMRNVSTSWSKLVFLKGKAQLQKASARTDYPPSHHSTP